MTTSGTWRLFVAVPIGEELRSELAASVEEWRERPDLTGLRWTDPAAWHLTLLFLGATDPGRVEDISSAIRAVVAHHEPMELTTGGLGGFGSTAKARVAWYGIHDADGGLRRLADDLRAALAPHEPGRFRAHVTLGRARGEPVDLRAWIREARLPAGRFAVADVHLMRSRLGRGPARYETLDRAALGVPVRV